MVILYYLQWSCLFMEEIVTTSFKIDKELLKKVKLQAIEEETNQSDIIVKSIKYYLRHLDKQTKLDMD